MSPVLNQRRRTGNRLRSQPQVRHRLCSTPPESFHRSEVGLCLPSRHARVAARKSRRFEHVEASERGSVGAMSMSMCWNLQSGPGPGRVRIMNFWSPAAYGSGFLRKIVALLAKPPTPACAIAGPFPASAQAASGRGSAPITALPLTSGGRILPIRRLRSPIAPMKARPDGAAMYRGSQFGSNFCL